MCAKLYFWSSLKYSLKIIQTGQTNLIVTEPMTHIKQTRNYIALYQILSVQHNMNKLFISLDTISAKWENACSINVVQHSYIVVLHISSLISAIFRRK